MRQMVSSGGPFENVYGYSRAVRVGDHIHVSGTTARPPDLDGDAYRQARAALSIVEHALRDVGSSLAAVVRTVTYVTDIDDAELVARAHREVFGDVRPAATLVQVTGLLGGARVEIEAYAVESP
jgi:enamine deaminase RidA (YjgF/YER057c/UK114 family)